MNRMYYICEFPLIKSQMNAMKRVCCGHIAGALQHIKSMFLLK